MAFCSLCNERAGRPDMGAGREWLAKLTTEESVRGRSLPDPRMMRPVGVTRELWFASLEREGRVESTIAGEQASQKTGLIAS
jgi:hypothetical protein